MLPPDRCQVHRPDLRRNAFYCVKHCPTHSLSVAPNPVFASMGDPRWTAGHDHWPPGSMAETGEPMPLDHPANMALGRRVRPNSMQLPRRQGQVPSGGVSHRDRPEPAQERTAGQDRHPGLRRRHVLRFGQHDDHGGKGHSGHRPGAPSPAPARAATRTSSSLTRTTSSPRSPPACSASGRRPSSAPRSSSSSTPRARSPVWADTCSTRRTPPRWPR